MWRTFVYTISLMLFLNCCLIQVGAQDTIPIPLKIKIGVEASGPVIHRFDKNISNFEGNISVDLDEKKTVFLAGGHLSYKYSQYNYTYNNNGSYFKAGIDFNLLKPDKSQGRYFAGIGLRYGLSRFNSEVPFLEKINYWDTTTMSLPKKTYWGHFIEVSPGVRAEIFKNLSIGWSVSLRMLIYTSTGKDLKPVYFPGFGDGTKTVTAGMSYYIVWNIPYRKINAIMKKEVPEETDDTKDTQTTGNKQQGTGIRQ